MSNNMLVIISYYFPGNLTNTDPQNFIYVELNAILMSNAIILARFFKLQKNNDKFNFYRNIMKSFQSGIDAVSDLCNNTEIHFNFILYSYYGIIHWEFGWIMTSLRNQIAIIFMHPI